MFKHRIQVNRLLHRGRHSVEQWRQFTRLKCGNEA